MRNFDAFNRQASNSQKKTSKFMRGYRSRYGKCWFDAKQTAQGRLQMAIYRNIEAKNEMSWMKPVSKLVI